MPPEGPKGWDVADLIEGGATLAEVGGYIAAGLKRKLPPAPQADKPDTLPAPPGPDESIGQNSLFRVLGIAGAKHCGAAYPERGHREVEVPGAGR